MEAYPLFEPIGISLLLGLLVGLQRERVGDPLAGLRTFPLISILGTLAALLDQQLEAGGWIVASGGLAVTAVIVLGNLQRYKDKSADFGITTEIAILLMFIVGAYLTVGDRIVAVAIGVGCALLLEFKPELHGFVAKLQNQDVRAVMQFALITFVVLPVLPNKNYGPPGLEVINPFEAWLLVVLIVGISFGGYVMYKLFGQAAGAVLGGILGGAISSTATTVSYARRAREAPASSHVAAMVVLIASAVVYIRLAIMIAVVSPTFFGIVAPPLGIMFVAAIIGAFVAGFGTKRQDGKMPEMTNPTELKSALIFGVMFMVILLGLATAKQYFGERAMYLVAGLSGLTDMDAIVLSTARLVGNGDGTQLDPTTGWHLIVLALMSNLVFKTGIAGVLGTRSLLAWIAGGFALQWLAGGVLLAFWP